MVGLPTSSKDGTATAESPVQVARALVPQLSAASSTIDELRRLPDEIVKALRDAGMFHIAFPDWVGGADYDPVTAAQVVEELAMGDASASWCVMLAAQMGGFVGFFPEDEAKRVFGDRQIAASSARPIGRAQAKDGGYAVSGRWPFASGSSHADWFGAECTVFDGAEKRKDADGDDVPRMLMVPARRGHHPRHLEHHRAPRDGQQRLQRRKRFRPARARPPDARRPAAHRPSNPPGDVARLYQPREPLPRHRARLYPGRNGAHPHETRLGR